VRVDAIAAVAAAVFLSSLFYFSPPSLLCVNIIPVNTPMKIFQQPFQSCVFSFRYEQQQQQQNILI
jgi:hypothetical protein